MTLPLLSSVTVLEVLLLALFAVALAIATFIHFVYIRPEEDLLELRRSWRKVYETTVRLAIGDATSQDQVDELEAILEAVRVLDAGWNLGWLEDEAKELLEEVGQLTARRDSLIEEFGRLSAVDSQDREVIASMLRHELERGDRSAKRDYLLFSAGLAVPVLGQGIYKLFTDYLFA